MSGKHNMPDKSLCSAMNDGGSYLGPDISQKNSVVRVRTAIRVLKYGAVWVAIAPCVWCTIRFCRYIAKEVCYNWGVCHYNNVASSHV